jgi:glycerophosphoryl diester phosphodiesterase
MKILAHRGSTTRNVIENTISAFQRALSFAADGIETDVRLTSDGAAVIIHDRVVGEDQLAVAKLTHAELESTVGHPVPLLGDLVNEVGPTFWNLEIKSRDAVDACCEYLEANKQQEWLVTSFDHRIVCEVARRTTVRCGPLTGHWVEDVGAFLDQFQAWPQVDTIVWNFDFVDARQMETTRESGFENYVWNALNDDDIRRCTKLPVDGIIVDDVEAAFKTVGRNS